MLTLGSCLHNTGVLPVMHVIIVVGISGNSLNHSEPGGACPLGTRRYADYARQDRSCGAAHGDLCMTLDKPDSNLCVGSNNPSALNVSGICMSCSHAADAEACNLYALAKRRGTAAACQFVSVKVRNVFAVQLVQSVF
jgi:hypothetical protein